MSEQNRYRLSREYKNEWWIDDEKYVWMRADSWQNAIHTWLENWGISYQLVSETPSEDSKSGIIEIQFDPPRDFLLGVKIKATLIED